MSFIDYIFMPLFLLSLVIYFNVPKRGQWIVLLCLSIAFYLTYGIELLPFALFSSLIAWGAGLLIGNRNEQLDERIKASVEKLPEPAPEIEAEGENEAPAVEDDSPEASQPQAPEPTPAPEIPEVLTKEQKRALRASTKRTNKYLLWLALFLIIAILVYIKCQNYILGTPTFKAISGAYENFCAALYNIPVLGALVADTDAIASATVPTAINLAGQETAASLATGVAIRANHGISLIVPLGISYYTMSLVGYLADVYWKKEKPEKNFFKLFLFAIYYPKILEGPISKHRLLASQLNAEHNFDYYRFCHGLQRMLWGYFKKLCIADRLTIMTSAVFASPMEYDGSVILVSAIFAAFELYCDFSGCMDMALGASHAMGIDIEENFKQPFLSKSAPEFWRRWHITLGVWFKDYVYMPLVTSPNLMKFVGFLRKHTNKRFAKAIMQIIPLAVVWLLTGLWHGTGINYIVWGIWWGLLMIVSTVFEPEFKKLNERLKINPNSRVHKMVQTVRTFFLFVVGRIITLSGDWDGLVRVLDKIVFDFAPWHFFDQSLYTYGLDRQNFQLVILCILGLMFVEFKQAHGYSVTEHIDNKRIWIRWIIYLAAIFFVLIFGAYGAGYDASSFVYANY